MKKIFNLIVWISSLSILLLSCTNDETENDKKPGDDDNNMVTVSLGAAGDILEVEETPLAKAKEAADVYGVQIYSSPKDEDNYKPYGYGLFSDKNKMQVELFKDRKYKFEMTLFPDNGPRGNLYLIKGSIPGLTVTDSIVYTEKDSLEVNRSSHWHYGDYDRYFGKLIDYLPKENAKVNIDLKRVVAGLTFQIKGLTDKSLLWIGCDSIYTYINGDGTTKEITVNKLICLIGEEKDYDKYYYTDKWFENPVEDIELKFRWTNDGHTEYFTQTVTFKRKMNYTFTITIPETFLVSNGITVTEEDAIWDNDIHVDNIYFGDLIIKNAADLEAIRGTQYTKITGDCIISDVEIPYPFSEFYYLQNVGGDFILNNVIASDSIFLSLNSVGKGFKILQTKDMAEDMRVVDLGCLVNLHKIGGNFEISSNFSNSFSNVRSINAYSLTKVGGDIIFKNLSALKGYCYLKTVLQNHKGQFITEGNAYNPTKEQILAGECSKD